MDATFVVLDSGRSLSQIPAGDFDEITTYLSVRHGLTFTLDEEQGEYYIDCPSATYDKLPDLQVTLKRNSKANEQNNNEAKIFTIPKSNYLINTAFYSKKYLFGF